MSDPESIRAQMQAVADSFSSQLPQRGDEILHQWQRCRSQPDAPDQLQDLYRLIHNLAGAGGTFGYAHVTRLARQLCDPLRAYLNGNVSVLPLEELQSLCDTLVQQCHSAVSGKIAWQLASLEASRSLMPDRKSCFQVYLYSNDRTLRQLISEIGTEGKTWCFFESADVFEQALAQAQPLVAVVDMQAPGVEQAIEVLQGAAEPTCRIALSSEVGFEARLASVRAGMEGFLEKPLTLRSLRSCLSTVDAVSRSPVKVLIVDDDREQARFAELVLAQAGIDVLLEHRPQRLLQRLESFRPDLLLLDVYMPQCGGLELARVVRQYERYRLLPILFLSVEQDRSSQLAALQAGADDFLAKPIQSQDLLASVLYRVRRARLLGAARPSTLS